MRRVAFGQLLCPEFTLRDLPRMTVRGQTVQGGSVPLRKAPLRSRMYPWSTRRPCGSLAFRRATEGSRVQRKVRGVKRGQETIRCPVPFCPPPWARRTPVGGHRHPRPPKAAIVHAHFERKSRLQRRAAVSAEINPLLRVKRKRARRSFATAQKKTLQRQRVVVC